MKIGQASSMSGGDRPECPILDALAGDEASLPGSPDETRRDRTRGKTIGKAMAMRKGAR